MYKVVTMFRDLTDDNHLYQPGDNFPRAGLSVSTERLEQLASSDNARGKPLIKPVGAPVKAKEAKTRETDTEAKKPAQKPRRSRKKE